MSSMQTAGRLPVTSDKRERGTWLKQNPKRMLPPTNKLYKQDIISPNKAYICFW